MSPIIDLTINEPNNQLISLSSDNVVKVWDLRNMKCVQTITESDRELIKSITYDGVNECLIGAGHRLRLRPLTREAVKGNEMIETPEQPVCGALYNSNFHQIISVDPRSNVCLWNVENGELISKFSALKQSAKKKENNEKGEFVPHITCMCFDEVGRRLITGMSDGLQVKMWNFSNGGHLKTLLKIDDSKLVEKASKPTSYERRSRSQKSHAVSRIQTGTKKNEEENTSRNNNMAMNDAESIISFHDLKDYGEFTSVTYVVNTLPRIPGQASVQNKYIVGAGWDRKIHIWPDGKRKGEVQGYVISAPTDGQKTHSDDILCLAFCPPNLVATGGYDGQVFLWNVNSGDLIGHMHVGQSVECLLYLKELTLLLCGKGDGELTFLNIKEWCIHAHVSCGHPQGEGIVALSTDEGNEYIFSGDTSGYVKIWDVLDPKFDDPFLEECSLFRAHSDRVASLDYVENNRLLETFLLTMSIQGEIALWTLNGACVGIFGQPNRWNLDDDRSFRCPTPEPLPDNITDWNDSLPENAVDHYWNDHDLSDDQKLELLLTEEKNKIDARNAEEMRKRSWKKSRSTSSSLNRQRKSKFVTRKQSMLQLQKKFFADQKIAKSLRKPKAPRKREVWIKRGERDAYQGIITIHSVDEGRGLIFGWDGLALPDGNGKQIHPKQMSLFDLLKVKDKYPWTKSEEHTELVGRVYADEVTGKPFKLLYLVRSPDHPINESTKQALRNINYELGEELNWVAVDSTFHLHATPSVKSRFLQGRKAARSLSIFKRRKSQFTQGSHRKSLTNSKRNSMRLLTTIRDDDDQVITIGGNLVVAPVNQHRQSQDASTMQTKKRGSGSNKFKLPSISESSQRAAAAAFASNYEQEELQANENDENSTSMTPASSEQSHDGEGRHMHNNGTHTPSETTTGSIEMKQQKQFLPAPPTSMPHQRHYTNSKPKLSSSTSNSDIADVLRKSYDWRRKPRMTVRLPTDKRDIYTMGNIDSTGWEEQLEMIKTRDK
eukprot:g3840.t1